jgi:tripartite-type tricarboxylate transporter receptor subunit TctC
MMHRHGFPVSIAAPSLTSCHVTAQDFPTQPIRLLVPTQPDGSADLRARLVAKHLRDLLEGLWYGRPAPT